MTFKPGDRVKIDATTDSRLAAKTDGQYGTVLRNAAYSNKLDYTVKLDTNPFVLRYSHMDLMPA